MSNYHIWKRESWGVETTLLTTSYHLECFVDVYALWPMMTWRHFIINSCCVLFLIPQGWMWRACAHTVVLSQCLLRWHLSYIISSYLTSTEWGEPVHIPWYYLLSWQCTHLSYIISSYLTSTEWGEPAHVHGPRVDISLLLAMLPLIYHRFHHVQIRSSAESVAFYQ